MIAPFREATAASWPSWNPLTNGRQVIAGALGRVADRSVMSDVAAEVVQVESGKVAPVELGEAQELVVVESGDAAAEELDESAEVAEVVLVESGESVEEIYAGEPHSPRVLSNDIGVEHLSILKIIIHQSIKFA